MFTLISCKYTNTILNVYTTLSIKSFLNGASVEDTALHTLQECPAWEEERRVLGATIGNDLSLPAVVQAMVGGQPEWDAVASFCEAVMSAKEAAERERERAAVLLSRRNNRSRRRRNTDLRPP
ncbi:hypothetical protein K1T71_005314 [Dendrolimus kikuchii]|uniref:Uncharacterized protein n=1 Tax=Dendrolimus kikuchii TaxID=765133 RepID=A0ACC1D871_9NEOP|nr:hypothetical protein K1T71_005314 [Dendrolimus kikuchii]